MPLDSAPVLSPTDRLTDGNGLPVPGGVFSFFEAGTTTPKTIYSDSDLTQALGTSVTCDSGGYPTSDGSTKVMIYTGTTAYKLVATDADGATLWTLDDIPGAPEIPDVASAALPETPVVSRTSSYQILSTDQGKLINADPTGGSFAITLPNAVTVGDKWRIGVRHAGASTANVVAIRSAGGQTIGAPGQSAATSIALSGLGQCFWLVSDGAGWTVDTTAPPLMAPGGVVYFKVTDRLSAPPVSPVGGQRYIISSTPSGAWSTLGFSEDDIAESDGNGSWLKYTPGNGWMAWVDDEDLITVYHDGAWEDWSNVTAPQASTLKHAIFEHQESNGNSGGAGTSSAWTKRSLTTEVVNTITGAALATGSVTLPVGTYLIALEQKFSTAGSAGSGGTLVAQQRIAAGTAVLASTNLYGLSHEVGASASGSGLTFSATTTAAPTDTFLVEVTTAGTIEVQYYKSAGTLGLPSVEAAGATEVYARLHIIDLSSLQGPQGIQGPQGADGLDAAYAYQFSTSTSGDPGTGKIAVNHASLASATQVQISETDAYGAGLAAVLATWDDSTSTIKARLKFSKEGATQNFGEFSITGAGTDQGAYWTFPVTYIAHGGTVANADSLAVIVIEKGDKGDTGSTGATGATGATGTTGSAGPTMAVLFNFSSTTTDSDPGSGNFRLNHATPASATTAYFDNNERGGTAVNAWLDTFDDSGNSSLRGHLLLIDPAASTTFYLYAVSGSVVDGTGYRKITLTYIAGSGSFTNGNQVAVTFAMRGATGSGDLSSVNNLSDVAARYTSFDNLSVHGADVASASTTNLEAATGYLVDVTGTTTITAITLSEGHKRFVRFTGILTLTHGASLVLPGAASITTAAGDFAVFVGYAAGVVRCVAYFRAAGRTLNTGVSDTITKGYLVTPYNAGTKSSGTYTPDPADGNYQYATNGGAHTLAAPASDCAIDILYTNNGSAGSITFSGFTVGSSTGSALTTTNTNKFIISIRRINSVATYSIYALQ